MTSKIVACGLLEDKAWRLLLVLPRIEEKKKKKRIREICAALKSRRDYRGRSLEHSQ